MPKRLSIWTRLRRVVSFVLPRLSLWVYAAFVVVLFLIILGVHVVELRYATGEYGEPFGRDGPFGTLPKAFHNVVMFLFSGYDSARPTTTSAGYALVWFWQIVALAFPMFIVNDVAKVLRDTDLRVLLRGRVFISYRRADSSDITGRICDRFIGKYGKQALLMDVDAIPLGVDFRNYLDEEIRGCDVVLVVIGQDWATVTDDTGGRRLDDPRDVVRLEIEISLEHEIPVIPILVRGAHMPRVEDLPDSIKPLAYRNGIHVRPDPDFHGDMDRLMEGVQACFSQAKGKS